MAYLVTFHNIGLLLIWLGLHGALCDFDKTNIVESETRLWPYPILSGNFEDLTVNLEQRIKTKQETGASEDDDGKSVTIPTQIASSPLAAVYDGVLTARSITILQMYTTISSDWRFTHLGSMPWSSWLNSSVINLSEVHKVFESLVAGVKQNDEKYYPYETTLHILRRGDSVGLIQGSPDEVILLYFLKDSWPVNFYGELMLYEGEEIVMSVKPSFNRAIVWNSSLAYKPSSPSMNSKESLYFLLIKYTSNATKVDEFEARRIQRREEKETAEEDLFNSMKEVHRYYGNLSVAEHRIKDYTGTHGKKIHVFDDLFLSDDLLKLRKHVEDYGNYFFDDSLDEDSDNVQWISAINIELFIKTRLWSVIQKVAQFVSGIDTWHPYDISCNNIRAFDSTQNHQDCETWEDEWTFLVYLNQNWTIDYGGETAFYSDSEDNEYVASVRPKYGRAVIFEGIIPHSARPPSSVHLGPRFTFAVKLSINRWTALRKTLKQETAHEEYIHYAGLSTLQKYYSKQLNLLKREDTPLHERMMEQLSREGEQQEEEEVCESGGPCTDNIHPNRYTKDRHIKEMLADIAGEDEDSVEDSFIDLKDFPEVLLRKYFIYKSMADAGTDYDDLKGVLAQFFLDYSEMKRRYTKLLEIVL